jgi:hypothetical protein
MHISEMDKTMSPHCEEPQQLAELTALAAILKRARYGQVHSSYK